MPDVLKHIFSDAWSTVLIVVFFGGSIFVHEFGHFLAARRRGLKVDRFSIGFGPKVFSWMRDGVEYRVSWLPLGGYVALPQLADLRGLEGEPATDTAALPPISYADKMIVSVMGAVFNLLFAFGLGCVIWLFGLPTPEQQNTTVVGYVLPTLVLADGSEIPSPAAEAGMREGDRIVAIDHKKVADWNSLLNTLISGVGRDERGRPEAIITIERDGAVRDLDVHPRVTGEERRRRIGIVPAEPMIIDETLPDSPAARAGLRRGDKIVAVDGNRFHSVAQMQAYVAKNADRDLAFQVLRASDRTFETSRALQDFINAAPSGDEAITPARGAQTLQVTMRPVPVKYTRDGAAIPSVGVAYFDPIRTTHPDPVSQFRLILTLTYRNLKGLVHPHSDLGIADVSGPPDIVRILYATSRIDVRLVIWITILINISLAVFNLLPIPVLDGGHMMFATMARLRGHALPARFIAATQGTFMILLLSLMVFVSYKNIGRWVHDTREDRRDQENAVAPVFPKADTP